MAGLRVVRGPEWKWQDQDGGDGVCGTATGNKASAGWINILWDGGRKNDYRAGAKDASDLLVLDNGATGVKHPHVMCDVCNENNIRGIRWKCVDCPNYDLCTECYGNDRHDMNHRFMRINIPEGDRTNVGRRKNAVKIQSRGLYPGATVVRGEDWDKGNQDGGVGNVGKITKIGYVQEKVDKAALVVEWTTDPSQGYIYRRGLGGNVDVKCKTPAAGWCYYRDHLPALRDIREVTSNSLTRADSTEKDVGELLAELFASSLLGALGGKKRAEVERRFKAGDVVRLSDDIEKVQQLQKGHGGFNLLMVPALGKNGVVIGIDSDGDVKVKFGLVDWTLNPDLLTKQAVSQARTTQAVVKPASPRSPSAFKSGDRIVICKDEAAVRRLQNGHGGWTDHMRPFVNTGVVGIVRSVDDDNDVHAAFGDRTFLLNPEICSAPPNKSKTQNVDQGSKLKVGDKVLMDKDLDFVKRKQNGHGGWTANMKKVATTPGTVKSIDGDGDIRVDCEGESWVFNPECLHIAKTESKPLSKTKDVNVPKGQDSGPFSVGDHVRLDKDADFVKRVQAGHGGWCDDMRKAMTSVGRVVGVDEDGDLQVLFGDKEWTLNPEACHKAAEHEVRTGARPKAKDKNVNVGKKVECPFKSGDKVMLIRDTESIKRLQKGHGGWNDSILKELPNVGRIAKVDDDGDIMVDFGDTVWTLNPEVCQKYDKSRANVTPQPSTSKQQNEGATAGPSRPRLPARKKPRFEKDEQVKILVTESELQDLQRGHGGWSANMKNTIGRIGVVLSTDVDGDVKVKFPTATYTFNPEALTSMEASKNKQAAGSEQPPKIPPKPNGSRQNSITFRARDCVRIPKELDAATVIQLQKGHGGWNAAMARFIGQAGVVNDVFANGDIEVSFGDNSWTFNADIFEKIETDSRSVKMPGKQGGSFSMTTYQCSICFERGINMVFNCGHGTCAECSKSIDNCHICRQKIVLRTKMFL